MGVCKGLIVAKLLLPREYGVSTAVSVIMAYAQYADLGSCMAAYRDFTSALGRNDQPSADRYSKWMSGLKLTSLLLVGVGCLAASFWPGIDPSFSLGLRLVPTMAISSGLLFVVLLVLQAHGHFYELNRVTTVSAGLDLLLGVGLTWRFGLPGLLAAGAISPSLAAAWVSLSGRLIPPASIPFATVRGYIATGVPLVALGLIDHNLVYVDHLVVLTFFSLSHLGIYNIALIAADLLRLLGLATGIVLGPRLVKDYARSGGRMEEIRQQTIVPVLLLACIVPFVIVGLWFGGGYAIRVFYPKYAAAILPMRILLFGFYFLVVDAGVTYFLFAIDKHRRNLVIAGPALVFNLVIDVILIRAGWGLSAVAVGSLVTFAAYAAVHLWYVASHFLKGSEWLAFVGGITLPALYLGILLALGTLALPPRWSEIARTATACVLAWVLLLPLGARGLRFARLLDTIAVAQPVVSTDGG
jgi:O-antigen/teichoic acid export membrane protein